MQHISYQLCKSLYRRMPQTIQFLALRSNRYSSSGPPRQAWPKCSFRCETTSLVEHLVGMHSKSFQCPFNCVGYHFDRYCTTSDICHSYGYGIFVCRIKILARVEEQCRHERTCNACARQCHRYSRRN